MRLLHVTNTRYDVVPRGVSLAGPPSPSYHSPSYPIATCYRSLLPDARCTIRTKATRRTLLAISLSAFQPNHPRHAPIVSDVAHRDHDQPRSPSTQIVDVIDGSTCHSIRSQPQTQLHVATNTTQTIRTRSLPASARHAAPILPIHHIPCILIPPAYHPTVHPFPTLRLRLRARHPGARTTTFRNPSPISHSSCSLRRYAGDTTRVRPYPDSSQSPSLVLGTLKPTPNPKSPIPLFCYHLSHTHPYASRRITHQHPLRSRHVSPNHQHFINPLSIRRNGGLGIYSKYSIAYPNAIKGFRELGLGW